jgi:hypothetical protein
MNLPSSLSCSTCSDLGFKFCHCEADSKPTYTPDLNAAQLAALKEKQAAVMAAASDDKPTNPKDLIATNKLPTWLVSPIVRAYDAIAHYLGNVKYGAWNWRGAGARVSVYKSALDRHMDAFMEGEWYDPTDGTPHLANAKACINIIIDSYHAGKLIDDRPPSNAAELARVRAEFEALMPKIRERYKDKDPKHWTIEDKLAETRP